MILLVLLPLLSFVSGVASLQIDPKEQPKKKWVLVVILVLSLMGSVIASLNDNSDKKREQLAAADQKNKDDEKITMLIDTSNQLSGKADTILLTLEQWGFSPQDLHRVQQSQKADQLRTALLPEAQANNRSAQATVLYFPKNVDGLRVVDALTQGGFHVEKQQRGERNPGLATNAVWAGNDVKVETAKFVALTLIRAGVEIKAIRRLPNGGGKRANLIEVASDIDFKNATALTVAEVDNLKDLPPR
jgi:hypothetical protein